MSRVQELEKLLARAQALVACAGVARKGSFMDDACTLIADMSNELTRIDTSSAFATGQFPKLKSQYGYLRDGTKIEPPKGWKILPEYLEVPHTHREFLQGYPTPCQWAEPRRCRSTMTPIWAHAPWGYVMAIAVPEDFDTSTLRDWRPEAMRSENPCRIVTIKYTNWRGHTSFRRIIPVEVWFGSTEYHKEPQWLLKAVCYVNFAMRDFALKDIHSWESTFLEAADGGSR